MATYTPEIEWIEIEKFMFDPKNPRLPGYLKGGDESEVLRWMLNDATLIELMGAIGAQGFFPGEPLLGYKDENGAYIVVEGNRRLAASKLLLHPELAPTKKKVVQAISSESPNKPQSLPMFVYPRREDILSFLGYRHVTGIKRWDPLSRARYLQQLFDMEDSKGDILDKFRSVAKKIGTRADYAAVLLTTYALYRKIEELEFFGIKNLDEDTLDFGILQTALHYNNLTSFLGLKSPRDPSLAGLDLKRLEELTNWLFARNAEDQTRLGESRNLDTLSKIVANDKALAAWRLGASLDYAVMLTDAPAEIFNTSLIAAQDNLRIAREYSHQVKKPEKSIFTVLIDIKDIAQDLYDLMMKRLK